jgi:outer membrane lipoprotein-sorting protein
MKRRDRGTSQTLAALAAALLALALTLAAGTLAAGPLPENGCPPGPPEQLYARLKQETFAHNAYTATYSHSTERGARHEIYARTRLTGKYLRDPAILCEKKLGQDSSFPEQAGIGEQECYTGSDDLVRILMPGAYRALGVIVMFPEDPKASYLNGENMKRTAVWTWFPEWDRMLEGGKLTARCERYKNQPVHVLIIQRGKNPDPLYHLDEVHVFVDPERWFPIRVEKYTPGDPKPVVIYEFEEVTLDPPITEKDIAFEGMAPGWNLISESGGPKLAGLKAPEPKVTEPAGLDALAVLAMLDAALAPVKDYTTELTLEIRYLRLRQYRTDQFKYRRDGNAFSALTTHLETNYMLINGGENFRTVYDPAKDKLIHVIPAGVYKVMGEQTFPRDDPRLFSALGDNITDLGFFALRDQLKSALASAESKKAGLAASGPTPGPWLELTAKNLGIPAQPNVTRLLLDPQTHLPARLEYRGYDDPQGYVAVSFANTKVNTGLNNEELWK